MSRNEQLIIELERAKIELEHSTILEARNAMIIALVTIPFAIVTIANQVGLITNSGQLFATALLAALSARLIYDKVIEFNRRLRETEDKIDTLITRAQEIGSHSAR